jgi:RNA polymerase sigma factor (sigma-70 family)
VTDIASQRVIEAVWRIESAKLIAALTRMIHDVGIAEDVAQDALVIALEKWPVTGIPDNPGAWLMTAAKRRAIDLLRRDKLRGQKYEEVGRSTELYTEADLDATGSEEIGDDLLRLIFMTCHPVLSREGRVALTMRLLGGLTTEEIARSFLVSEPTIAQRIVRAKRTLREARAAFDTPSGEELQERLAAVLEVIYLMFNEGYTATAGNSWTRPLLCQEALRLARILAEIASNEPEVHGLAALLELQSSRLKARLTPSGEPILLADQNRSLWDRLLIRRGLAALERARSLGKPFGPYALQAAITACHAEARTVEETNWMRIAALYEALSRVQPSPVVELNRAVAIGMAFGPEFGLQLVEQLERGALLRDYHLLPSVKGDFLSKLGRMDEARAAFERAAAMTRNERERELLQKRAASCGATD